MWTIIYVVGILCIKSVLARSVTSDLATDIQQLLHRVQMVEDKGRQYEETISTMKNQIERLEGKVAVLEIANVEKQAMIDTLQDNLNGVSDVFTEHDILDDTPGNTKDMHNGDSNVTTENDTLTDTSNAIGEPGSESQNNNDQTDTDTHQTPVQTINNSRQQKAKTAISTDLHVSNIHLEKTETTQTQRKRRLAVTPENIAFHASASTTQENLHVGENIVLDTVLLNVGNGYHDEHGLFIAPVSGIYVFSISVMNDDAHDDWILLNVLKNGNTLGRIMADGRHGGYDQGSMTVPIQLEEGDEIWLEVFHPETNVNFYGGFYTSFSGFLLSTIG